MASKNTIKNQKLFFVIIALIFLVGVLHFSSGRSSTNEMAEAPDESWLIAVDTKNNISFKYPEQLPTKYIKTVDWPPFVEVLAQPFSCNEAGLEQESAGETEIRIVAGRRYCVTKESGGAAGSVYTNYAYAFERGGQTFIFTFGLRAVQCGNYNETEKILCERERQSFDLDRVIDQMAQSIY